MEHSFFTPGTIVKYKTTETERALMIHNECKGQEILPALIVSVHGKEKGSAVNLRIFVDGPGHCDFHKTSVYMDDKYKGEGTFHF